MKIYIDGDGCPVKEETLQVGEKFSLPVILVTSFDHYSKKNQGKFTQTIYVDPGADSADYKILSLAKRGDLCITQDYGLASLLLAKNVFVFHQKFKYEKETIDFLLQSRYEGQLLKKGGKHLTGPSAFTPQDGKKFQKSLENFLEVELKQ